MELADLTKEELLMIIKQKWYQPTQKDILDIHWQFLNQSARKLMDESIAEGKKWKGKKDMESYAKWMQSQKMFDKAMQIDEEADKIYKPMEALHGETK